MRVLLSLLLLVSLLTPACAPPPKRVSIISEPPGARILIDENYIGDAPVEIMLRQDTDYHIVAYPTPEMIGASGEVQYKRFRQTQYDPPIFVVPDRILFDMRLGTLPRRQEIDADIRIREGPP